jgi:NADH-quinone oxidoreductase subunit C
MDFHAIHDHLKAVGAPGLVGVDEPRGPNKETKDKGRFGDPFVIVDPRELPRFLHVCRDDPRLKFEMAADLSATDPSKDDENLWINVQLLSVTHKPRLAIKCILPKSAPSLPTTTTVYRTCQWHERECAEMFGITFEGHPDPRHILLPDDWVGHPLRKDYVFPDEYHGISCK